MVRMRRLCSCQSLAVFPTLLYLFVTPIWGLYVLPTTTTMEAQHFQLRDLDSQLPVSTLSLGSSVSPGLCLLTCEMARQTTGTLEGTYTGPIIVSETVIQRGLGTPKAALRFWTESRAPGHRSNLASCNISAQG